MENLFNTFSYDVWHTEQDVKVSRKKKKERANKFKEMMENEVKKKKSKKDKKKAKKKEKKKRKKVEKERAESEMSTKRSKKSKMSDAQLQQLLSALSVQQETARGAGEDTTQLQNQIDELQRQAAMSRTRIYSGPSPSTLSAPSIMADSGTDDSSADSDDDVDPRLLVEIIPEQEKRRGRLPLFKANALPLSGQDQLGRPRPKLGKIGRSVSEGGNQSKFRTGPWRHNRTPSPHKSSESDSQDDSESDSDESSESSVEIKKVAKKRR